jgi:hypothetical protein
VTGGDRVERAHRVDRLAERLAERGGGGHAGTQAGERPRPDAADDRVDVGERAADLAERGEDVRGQQLSVRLGVHRDALGQHGHLLRIDDPGGDRGGRGVHRENQHDNRV